MTKDSESTETVGVFKTALNKKLIELFKTQGKKVFEFPVNDHHRLNLNTEQVNLLKNITEFDWIIFPDIWAVEHFFEIVENQNFDLFDLDNIRICSFGEAVADSLRYRQIHSDIIPSRVLHQTVFQSIEDYISGETELKDLKFLVLKPAGGDLKLAALLSENSAKVCELEIYKIDKFDESEFSKLKALLVGGAIDEFIFNAPEDVLNLAVMIGIENLSKVLADINVRAFNEVTRQTLSEFDLKDKDQKRG